MNDIKIAVEHLSKEYKMGMAVEDVSFQIRKKGIYGLVGPNGAGKTTIMKMLGGLVHPTAGEIHMYGKTGEENLNEARKHASFLIENPYLRLGSTAHQNLEKQRIMKGLQDKGRIEEVLELVGLLDVNKKKTVRKYSLGMKQRLGIAGALLAEPDLLVLDEPINGLDPEGIIEIRELLLNLNQTKEMTILISSHILTELFLLCTDYLFINRGKIIKNITREQLIDECGANPSLHINGAQTQNLEEYYMSAIKESSGRI